MAWNGPVSSIFAARARQAREWANLLAGVRRVGGPALLALLATGIYLTATRWGEQGWISAGLVGLMLIAVLGAALTGRRAGAIARALGTEEGSVPAALADRLRDPVLLVSAWVRTGLALGIVYVMSAKPNGAGALAAMGVALVLGLAAGSFTWGRSAAPLRAHAEGS